MKLADIEARISAGSYGTNNQAHEDIKWLCAALEAERNLAQPYINALEGVCDVLSDAEAFGTPISPHKIHAAIRSNLEGTS